MRTIGRWIVCAFVVLVPASAAHASDEVGLSRDGVTWSANGLQAPLFDPDVRWVPGDVRTERFFVRNQSDDKGRLVIDLEGSERDSLLRSDDLLVEVQVGDGPWTSTTDAGTQRLAEGDVPPGERRAVRIRVTFDGSSTNATQTLDLDLDLQVTLSEDTEQGNGGAGGDGDGAGDGDADADGGAGNLPGDGGGGAGGGDLGGLLPDTGASSDLRALGAMAAVAVAVGCVLAGRRREDGAS